MLVFVNGIPLGLLELKNPADEHATLKGAWNQVQTYRTDIPAIFTPNAVTVISDGISAAMSSFTGGFEHYAPWKTIDGREVVTGLPALEVLIKGVFEPARFLDIVKNFIVFSDEPNGPGQARREVPPVLGGQRRRRVDGRGRRPGRRPARRRRLAHAGVAASSIEMLLYAAKIMRDPRMGNPTLVFLTDRNDLDDQLFGEVFAPAEILPEKPVQADSRADLRDAAATRVRRHHLHDAAEVRARARAATPTRC